MTSPLYTLYYGPGMANLAPHMVLEELGVPHALVQVDAKSGEHRREPYLSLNPTGRIPVLLDHAPDAGGRPIFETAAIMLHLADRHPEGGVMPPVGSPDRALAYQWLIHLTNTVQPAYVMYYYPERFVSDPGTAPDVMATAQARLMEMFALLDRALEGRDWLVGDRPTLADLFLLMMVRWGRNFAGRKPRDLPNLSRHAAAVMARPAIRRAFAAEGLAEPFY
ncbi:MAG: hypothetical protein RLY86_3110 [Pseudomonadota bacterium]|jgi:glutathione S-transferase